MREISAEAAKETDGNRLPGRDHEDDTQGLTFDVPFESRGIGILERYI